MAKHVCVLVFTLFVHVSSQRSCEIKDKSVLDDCKRGRQLQSDRFKVTLCAYYCTECIFDPCKRFNTREIPFLASRHPSVPYSAETQDINKFCDLFALQNGIWYISDYNMTTACVAQESCGSRLPLWLNGTIPSQAEGAVNRSACLKTYDVCCKKMYTLMIKNCNYYNVYCFWELPDGCPQRFCFDADLSRVTTTTTTSSTTTTSTTTTTTAVMSKGTTTSSNRQPNKEKPSAKQGDSGVVIGLTSVVVLSVTANVVLSGFIVILKKKLAITVLPNTGQVEKVAIF